MKKILVLSMLAVAGASQAVLVCGNGGAIPDNAPSSPFTSTITITDGGTLNSITLVGLSHTWAGDLIATVSGGVGSLMNRVGATVTGNVGDSSDFGGDYTFSNSGGDLWAAAAAAGGTAIIAGGNYRATGANSSAPLTLPGTIGPGTYTLTISDNAGLDTGSLNGWCIDYTPVPEPATMAVLGAGALALIRRRRSK